MTGFDIWRPIRAKGAGRLHADLNAKTIRIAGGPRTNNPNNPSQQVKPMTNRRQPHRHQGHDPHGPQTRPQHAARSNHRRNSLTGLITQIG